MNGDDAQDCGFSIESCPQFPIATFLQVAVFAYLCVLFDRVFMKILVPAPIVALI